MIHRTYIYIFNQAAHVAEDFSPNENDKAMERLKKLGPGGGNKLNSSEGK